MKNNWDIKPMENAFKDVSMSMPRTTESEEKDVWKPLHKVVSKKLCDGFMYMGKYKYMYINPQNQKAIVETYDYKHGITRRYLHITKSGKCYCNVGRSLNDYILVEPCSKQKAFDIVFKGISKFGATPETKYDEQYRAERNKALAEAGFVTFDVSPGKLRKTTKEYSIEEEF